MDYLQQLDTQALLLLNGMHTAFLDRFMWLVANRFAWALMVAVLLALLARQGWRRSLVMLVAIALTVLIADQLASGLIKPLVMRLRPSHDPRLEHTLHILNGYRGGLYGFVSSHASNTFGVALLVMLLLRNRWATLTLCAWTALVCYSRMYEGVHYPGDILGGLLVGALAAVAVHAACRRLWLRHPQLQVHFDEVDAKWLIFGFFVNLLILIGLAVF